MTAPTHAPSAAAARCAAVAAQRAATPDRSDFSDLAGTRTDPAGGLS